MRGDRGDIVIGWLVRITLILTIFAIVAFDVVAIGLTQIGAQDDGTQAATAASESYQSTHNVQRAYAAATDYAEAHGATVETKTFRVDPDGRVHLTIRKTATTLVFYRIAPLKKMTTITASAQAKAVPGS